MKNDKKRYVGHTPLNISFPLINILSKKVEFSPLNINIF